MSKGPRGQRQIPEAAKLEGDFLELRLPLKAFAKRRYYRQEENQDISRQDMQNEPVRARIQAFMESRGFPELWAADEYTAYFEKIFGDDKERARAGSRAHSEYVWPGLLDFRSMEPILSGIRQA